jgi:hypothetical protein
MSSTKLLIIFSAISFLFIIIIYSLIWLNRGSDKTWLIFGKAIILPVLLGLGMLVYELFLIPNPKDIAEINVLLLHNDKFEMPDMHSISMSSNIGCGLGYSDLYSNLKHWKTVTKVNLINISSYQEQEEIYLDLVEATIWNWLIKNYYHNWKIERQKFKGIGGLLITYKPFKFDDKQIFINDASEKNKYVLKWPKLAKLLSENVFITDTPIYPLGEITFPPNSKIQVFREKGKRIIKISNIYLELYITIINTGGESVLEQIIGQIGKKINKVLSPAPTFSSIFPINIRCSYTPWLKGSPYCIEQKEWVQNLISNLKNDNAYCLSSENVMLEVFTQA